MNYTTRQIANVSGVSVQAVHKHIQKQGIEPVETRGKTFYYSFEDAVKVVNLIKPDVKVAEVNNGLIVINNTDEDNQATSDVIEILKQQLVVKDEFIKELNDRLKEASQERERLWEQVQSQRKIIEANAGKELMQAAARSQDEDEQPDSEVVDGESSEVVTEPKPSKRSFRQRLRDAVSAFKK